MFIEGIKFMLPLVRPTYIRLGRYSHDTRVFILSPDVPDYLRADSD